MLSISDMEHTINENERKKNNIVNWLKMNQRTRQRTWTRPRTILLNILYLGLFEICGVRFKQNLQYFRWSLRMRMQFMHIIYVYNTKDIDTDAKLFSIHTHHYIFLSRFFVSCSVRCFFFSLCIYISKIKNLNVVVCIFLCRIFY